MEVFDPVSTKWSIVRALHPLIGNPSHMVVNEGQLMTFYSSKSTKRCPKIEELDRWNLGPKRLGDETIIAAGIIPFP